MVEVLADERLVVTGRNVGGDRTATLAHEALQIADAGESTRVAGLAWKEYLRLRYLGAAEPDLEQLVRAARATQRTAPGERIRRLAGTARS